MSDETDDDGFVFDLHGNMPFLRKVDQNIMEDLRGLLIDDDALDQHFSKRLREEIKLFWDNVDLDLYGETAVVFPDLDHDYLEPRKFDVFETFVTGLESTAVEDLPKTEALLLKCLEAVRKLMDGNGT